MLARLTPADLSDAAFPFMTAQEITVGDVPVRALRVTFVGELGWELYAPAEYGRRLWAVVLGARRGRTACVPCGYRAIESLRLEKGYRVWGTDLTPETTPYEAGLGFCVKLGKPGGFVGADALRRVKADGRAPPAAPASCSTTRATSCSAGSRCSAGRPTAAVLGRVTSGGSGWSLGASIAYAYLPLEAAVAGTRLEVDLFGVPRAATVTAQPLFDPEGLRVRG